jgi:hypothetical protein
VSRQGEYSKEGKRITAPRTPVPKNALSAPRHADAPTPRSHEGSSGVFFVNRATGTAIAGLLIFLLGGIAYVGSTFFTREHQLDHVIDEQKKMRHDLDTLKMENQTFERRMVELSTQLENMEDAGD